MNPRLRRILIPLVVGLAALGVVLVVLFSPGRTPQSTSTQSQPQTQAQQPSSEAASDVPEAEQQASSQGTSGAAQDSASQTTPPPTKIDSISLTGLTAVAPEGAPADRTAPPPPLGSLDPREHHMQLDFAWAGAGIDAIRFSNIWETAGAKRQAQAYFETLSPSEPIDEQKLPQDQRYVLQTTLPFQWWDSQADQWRTTPVPVLAAHSILINGQRVPLMVDSVWTMTSPGRFETRIVNDQNQPIAEIVRHFELLPPFGIKLNQVVRNLSGQPLEVQWQQYGPPELRTDPSGYIERRRFDIGYLPSPQTTPNIVISDDDDLAFDRKDVIDLHREARTATDPQRRLELLRLWPNRVSQNAGYGLSWFSSINRYFALAVFPMLDAQGQGPHSLAGTVQEIRHDVSGPDGSEVVLTFLISPTQTIAPETEASFGLNVFAGPLDSDVLAQPPYSAVALDQMILYSMGGCCTFLTFQWLAHGLLWFLSFLHNWVVFDWGLAIIGLVIVVRALLHPLTKRSQINIQRFSKQMAAMKPEIDKIQKKYANDPKKAQQEQMRLMREHGVNPLQMLGCLPMFLQMPIWIALWAMLYFAFDIRQQPAFYGVFQLFGDWPFLADLSSQDNFIPLPGDGFTIPLINAQITAINLLPLLMGLVFWFQQKYMSPPPTPNMTPEQVQQQRIMRVMMVVMFPLFLYKAPSGLTLYIFTSTVIGILESKYIRAHIEQLDLSGPSTTGARTTPPKKPKDPWARAFAEKLERAKAKRQAQPTRSFKKRK